MLRESSHLPLLRVLGDLPVLRVLRRLLADALLSYPDQLNTETYTVWLYRVVNEPRLFRNHGWSQVVSRITGGPREH